MNLAVIDLDGPLGNWILGLYILGGILLFITSFFPGNKIGWRIFSAVAGAGIAIWAAYVLLFGGTIILNAYVAVLPFILAFKGISAMVKRNKNKDETPGYAAPASPYGAPQNGAPDQFGAAPSYQAQPGYPQQSQPGYPAQPGYPQQGQPAYAPNGYQQGQPPAYQDGQQPYQGDATAAPVYPPQPGQQYPGQHNPAQPGQQYPGQQGQQYPPQSPVQYQ
jgi:hypothetical protein